VLPFSDEGSCAYYCVFFFGVRNARFASPPRYDIIRARTKEKIKITRTKMCNRPVTATAVELFVRGAKKKNTTTKHTTKRLTIVDECGGEKKKAMMKRRKHKKKHTYRAE
jgi:hypothetical protein